MLKLRLSEIQKAGTFKHERIITSKQQATIDVHKEKPALNFCANNYLGLSDNPALLEAEKWTIDSLGLGALRKIDCC